jgi:hypothetical protein
MTQRRKHAKDILWKHRYIDPGIPRSTGEELPKFASMRKRPHPSRIEHESLPNMQWLRRQAGRKYVDVIRDWRTLVEFKYRHLIDWYIVQQHHVRYDDNGRPYNVDPTYRCKWMSQHYFWIGSRYLYVDRDGILRRGRDS